MSQVQSAGLPMTGNLPIHSAGFALDNLKMHADNVLVLLDHIRDAQAEEKRTSGGIILPKTTEAPKDLTQGCWGTVIAAGPGRYMDKWLDQERGHSVVGSKHFVPCEVKPGDRVLVQHGLVGDQIMVDGVEHRIIKEDVILMVTEE